MWSNVSQYNACNVSSLSVDGRIAGVPAEFRTERRRNKSEKRCHVSQLVHWKRTRHNVGAFANYWCRGKTLSVTYLFVCFVCVCVCESETEREHAWIRACVWVFGSMGVCMRVRACVRGSYPYCDLIYGLWLHHIFRHCLIIIIGKSHGT
jgi:hypothetical protein